MESPPVSPLGPGAPPPQDKQGFLSKLFGCFKGHQVVEKEESTLSNETVSEAMGEKEVWEEIPLHELPVVKIKREASEESLLERIGSALNAAKILLFPSTDEKMQKLFDEYEKVNENLTQANAALESLSRSENPDMRQLGKAIAKVESLQRKWETAKNGVIQFAINNIPKSNNVLRRMNGDIYLQIQKVIGLDGSCSEALKLLDSLKPGPAADSKQNRDFQEYTKHLIRTFEFKYKADKLYKAKSPMNPDVLAKSKESYQRMQEENELTAINELSQVFGDGTIEKPQQLPVEAAQGQEPSPNFLKPQEYGPHIEEQIRYLRGEVRMRRAQNEMLQMAPARLMNYSGQNPPQKYLELPALEAILQVYKELSPPDSSFKQAVIGRFSAPIDDKILNREILFALLSPVTEETLNAVSRWIELNK